MKLGERGFTLVELLIALAIMALVSGAMATATVQVFRCTERNNNRMTAVCQVQNAGYWISRDARRAQGLTSDNLTPPDFLALSWTDESTGDTYQVTYTLEDMSDGGLKKLLRSESVNGGANATVLVARYIEAGSDKTSCEFTDNTLILTVTATVGSGSQVETETRTCRTVPRLG
jgi:prepilin-type N-terminal cleavage/methylation domain-containing protein